MQICVINKSTLVTDGDVEMMTRACSVQAVQHFAPVWFLNAPTVTCLPPDTTSEQFPEGAIVIAVLDSGEQAGVLGWHTSVAGGRKFGTVFAKPVLDAGMNALTTQISVATVLSHEVLEAFADAPCNRWADRRDGSLVAFEVADPVEGDSYTVRSPDGDVTVSDFVLPAWFDPTAALGAPMDYLGLVTQPFQIRDTGYVVLMESGKTRNVYGARYPAWRKATKEDENSRMTIRLGEGDR